MSEDLNPDGLILSLLPWQAFGSCTFRKCGNSRRAVGLFLRVLRRATALWQVRGEAYWVLRFEQGEVAGREHFHFLVGGFPSRNMSGSKVDFFNVSGCLWWVHEWTCLTRGGWARCRPYVSECDAANFSIPYLLKSSLENRYERGKFSEIHHSAGLLRRLAAMDEGGASDVRGVRTGDETDSQGQTDSHRSLAT